MRRRYLSPYAATEPTDGHPDTLAFAHALDASIGAPRVLAAARVLEEALGPFRARPHWGKLFAMSPTRIQALYPMMPKLRQLLLRLDPAGKFRNAFVDRYVFAASVPHVPTAIMPH